MKEGGSGGEIVFKEVGWSKSGISDRIVKSNRQTYGIVKKDLPLTFDVNEGTYMHRIKLTDPNGISSKLQSKKYVKLMCTLGWIELTAILGGTKCGDGMWGVQNCVKKGGLCGPRNTTYYVKNG